MNHRSVGAPRDARDAKENVKNAAAQRMKRKQKLLLYTQQLTTTRSSNQQTNSNNAGVPCKHLLYDC